MKEHTIDLDSRRSLLLSASPSVVCVRMNALCRKFVTPWRHDDEGSHFYVVTTLTYTINILYYIIMMCTKYDDQDSINIII